MKAGGIFLNLILPGMGSMYVYRWLLGFIQAVAAIVVLALVFVDHGPLFGENGRLLLDRGPWFHVLGGVQIAIFAWSVYTVVTAKL